MNTQYRTGAPTALVRIALLGALAATLLAPPASAQDVPQQTLREAMGSIAGKLGRALKREGAESVTVKVSAPIGDGVGRKMKDAFIGALQEQFSDLEIDDTLPDCKLTLKYRRTDGSNDYAMEVLLDDQSGRTVGIFPHNFAFADLAERASTEGSNVDNTLSATGTEQPATRENIEQNLNGDRDVFVSTNTETPDSAVGALEKTIVSAREGSKFRIEVLAKPEGPGEYLPRPIATKKGFAFCSLADGEVYAVRVINDADHSVAVDLSIDGINMFVRSQVPGWSKLGKFLVPPRSAVDIPGWHFGENGDMDDYREFKIVEFPDSLAAEITSDEAALGQISAQFFAAWSPGEPQPTVEPVGAQGDSTGVGARVRKKTVSKVTFIGSSLLAAVTVRYTRPEPDDLPGLDTPPPAN